MKPPSRKSGHRDEVDLGCLEFVREVARDWRLDCALLDTLADDEREEVRYAVTIAGLRFASFPYRIAYRRPVAGSALTLVLFVSVWLIEEVIAFAVLGGSIARLSLAVDALLGLAIVAAKIEEAAVTSRERAVLQLAAVALGAVGGLAATRIEETSFQIVDRVLIVRDRRVRPRDQLIVALINSAVAAHRLRLARTARRLSSTFVLLTCAIVLPQVLNLGAYGSSVRAILSVSAALALLPGDAGGVVRDTLSKALPWQH